MDDLVETESGPPGRPTPYAGLRGEILVLSDGAADADLEAQLRVGGFTVRVCATDSNALKAAIHRPPALVLADVNPGDERQLTFGRRLQRALGPLAPPVIALVAGEDEEVFLRAYSFGVRDVLARPIPASLLRVKVARNARLNVEASSRIAGYSIKSVLGRGGMGIVYLAERGGRDYAVKVLDLTAGALEPEAIARFHREGEALRTLRGPGIPRFFEMGRSDDQLFVVMEYVPGESLLSVVERGPLDPAAVEHLMDEVLAALETIHAAGVVHRDVKPANVIMTAHGSAVLVDFGLAKRVDDRGLTRADEVLGTLHYMAPELLWGETATWRSDAYSLGMTALHAAAGRCPVEGSGLALAFKLSRGAIPRAADVIPQAPATLKQVIDGLLDRKPEARLGLAEARGRLRSGCQAPPITKKLAPFDSA